MSVRMYLNNQGDRLNIKDWWFSLGFYHIRLKDYEGEGSVCCLTFMFIFFSVCFSW